MIRRFHGFGYEELSMTKFKIPAWLVCLALFSTATIARAQQEVENPFTSAQDVSAGMKTFLSHCTTCHGRSGLGDRGPNLTLGSFRHAIDDASMFRVVRRGIPNTDMPGLYMGDTSIWQTVAYIRTLAQGQGSEPLSGDPINGERIFYTQEDCAQCHTINTKGAGGAPDLSNIGWQRSLAYLRSSLTEPNANVDPEWWGIRVTQTNGEITSGWRLNEDTFSIRLLDPDRNLLSFNKDELLAFERLEDSPMASYEDILSEQEMDDLVAFLYSLGRGKP
jgi:putative heme-binding domain-containing protein